METKMMTVKYTIAPIIMGVALVGPKTLWWGTPREAEENRSEFVRITVENGGSEIMVQLSYTDEE
jgi:hypothetical protein